MAGPVPARPGAAPVDDERIAAVALLVEASGAVLAALGRALERDSGMPLPWYGVLIRLARAPEGRLRMTDLTAGTSMTTSGVTRLVDRMEAAGLVSRESCPTDRRGAFATITPAGEEALAAATPDHLRAVDAHFTGRLEPAELKSLLAALRRLLDANTAAAQPAERAGA